MRAFVSVDWDFFIRSLYAWDWGHQESPFFIEGSMWEIRVSGLLANGLDIRDEMDPERWSKPRPLDFWNVLTGLGYNFGMLDELQESSELSTANFLVAESHAIAGPMFNQVADDIGPPEVILNFDAHHDMGYGDKVRVQRLVTRGEVTCDMWLRSLMSQDAFHAAKTRAAIIYPNWRFDEFPMSDEWESLRQVVPRGVLGRTEIGVFEKRDGSATSIVAPGEKIDVQALFICRSGAWSPPWLDDLFVRFVGAVDEHTGVLPYEYVSENTPDIMPLRPRASFSWKRAEAMAAQFKSMVDSRRDQ